MKDPAKAVWIGKVPAGTTPEELLELAKTAGDAKWAEVFKNSGVVEFGSADEVPTAIELLNGAMLGSDTIIADVWEAPKKPEAEKGGKGKAPGVVAVPGQKGTPTGFKGAAKGGAWTPSWTPTWKTPFQNQQKGGWSEGKGGGGRRNKVKDAAKAVWIGNLPEGVTYKELLEAAKQVSDAKWAEVFRGTGAVGFGTDEEASDAIVALNGLEVGGQAIIADVWEKKST